MEAPFGYRTFEVEMGDWVELPLKLSGDRAAMPYLVPQKVDIIAKDRSL